MRTWRECLSYCCCLDAWIANPPEPVKSKSKVAAVAPHFAFTRRSGDADAALSVTHSGSGQSHQNREAFQRPTPNAQRRRLSPCAEVFLLGTLLYFDAFALHSGCPPIAQASTIPPWADAHFAAASRFQRQKCRRSQCALATNSHRFYKRITTVAARSAKKFTSLPVIASDPADLHDSINPFIP